MFLPKLGPWQSLRPVFLEDVEVHRRADWLCKVRLEPAARQASMFAAAQKQIAKCVADMTVLILVWRIAEAIHAATNADALEMVATRQGFAETAT